MSNTTMLTMTMDDLERLLNDQKKTIANYITRNTSVYHWNNGQGTPVNTDLAKKELIEQAMKAPYAEDFQTLQRYHKPTS